MAWGVRWRALDERFASLWDALDRLEQLDEFGREPELFEVSVAGERRVWR